MNDTERLVVLVNCLAEAVGTLALSATGTVPLSRADYRHIRGLVDKASHEAAVIAARAEDHS